MATATQATLSARVKCPDDHTSQIEATLSSLKYFPTFFSRHISQRTLQVTLLGTPMQNLMLSTRVAASKPVIMNKSLCF